MKPLENARVAIVHEWLIVYGGSERVVVDILRAFPQADLFATAYDREGVRGTPLENVPVRTTRIQSLPSVEKRYRTYLPLMPLAVEQLDLRRYDLIISSNHAVAKGVLTRADQLHISYTHTPIRYAWDLYLDYLSASGMDRGPKTWLVRPLLHYLRMWDTLAAERVDAYLANSLNVSRRIWKLYRRSSQVLYPPVDVGRYQCDLPREEFYVTVSRFVPYKRIDLIIDAFTRMGKPLVVIGEGSESKQVQRLAGSNVKLLGYQSDEVVTHYLQQARAFVFAADEDFGIIPIEAQAAGCPVIAYSKGGALETVVGWPAPEATGVLYDVQTPEALETAVQHFEAHEDDFTPAACRRNAERFGRERFGRELRATVANLWDRFHSGENLE